MDNIECPNFLSTIIVKNYQIKKALTKVCEIFFSYLFWEKKVRGDSFFNKISIKIILPTKSVEKADK